MESLVEPSDAERSRAYDALPPAERSLLHVLAMLGGPTSLTALGAAATRANAELAPAVTKSFARCRRALEAWAAAGLVREHRPDAWNGGYVCHPLIRERALREVWGDGAEGVSPHDVAPRFDYSYSRHVMVPAFLHGLYSGDRHSLDSAARAFERLGTGWEQVFPGGVTAYELERLPEALQREVGDYAATTSLLSLGPGADSSSELRASWSPLAPGGEGRVQSDTLAAARALLDVLRGDARAAETVLVGRESPDAVVARAAMALFRGDTGGARTLAFDAVKRWETKRKGERQTLLPPLADVALLLLFTGTDADRSLARMKLPRLRGWPTRDLFEDFERRQREPGRFAGAPVPSVVGWWLGGVIGVLIARWFDVSVPAGVLESTHRTRELAARRGYVWLVAELECLGAAPPSAPSGPASSDAATPSLLLSLFDIVPRWEHTLASLEALVASRPEPTEQPEQRLCWFLEERDATARRGDDRGDRTASSRIGVRARIQKATKRGWSQGRKVPLSSLLEQRHAPWLEDRDRAVIEHIVPVRAGYYSYRSEGHELGDRGHLALAEHPRVYWSDGSAADVSVRKPEVRVASRAGGTLEVRLCPPEITTTGLIPQRQGAQLVWYEVRDAHVRLAAALGSGARVPSQQAQRVAEVVGKLASVVSVRSDVASSADNVTTTPADERLYVWLFRRGPALRVRMCMQPLGEDGPAALPGKGSDVLMAEVGGRTLQTQRNHRRERQLLRRALGACPTLSSLPREGLDAVADGLEESLSVLLELGPFGDAGDVVLKWKEGQPLAVGREVGLGELRVSFATAEHWLAADVRVEVADGERLRVFDLLERLAGSGRFVELDRDRWIAVTDQLRAKLAHIASMGRARKQRIELPAAAACALDGWLGELTAPGALGAREGAPGIDGAALVESRLARVREAATLSPAIPRRFGAELRDYQRSGYQWMCRLAHWGAGALLCDDMGLGKTVQALAVLCARAADGPALVMAPTSVCAHWQELARRFAPALRVVVFAAGDRSRDVSQLGPGDLLIVSHGLVHTEAGLLGSIEFSTAIFDEAQAIKNPRSKRARAAHAIRARFRLATTGTPVENHLGELWSVMEFCNPGLLGTMTSFQDRFGKPIQQHGSRDAADTLRRLIRPFVLRRTKGQVLDELPEKTEVIIPVELSAQEASFYEALRLHTVDSLAANAEQADSRRRFQFLAALMRLRRAACHPRLVDDGFQGTGAKHEVLDDLVRRLIDGGHRALVFSQFVDHLALVRQHLDEQGISYQYLDGSTSAAQRRKRVAAFQSGAGDLFLISLKAGGVGLDLTGADYVIHLDPWWNPAVEDQATDRAHRFGQTRPVTVYRLVAQNTVEQRVVELHGRKRKLAEELLASTDTVPTVDLDELVSLVR